MNDTKKIFFSFSKTKRTLYFVDKTVTKLLHLIQRVF